MCWLIIVVESSCRRLALKLSTVDECPSGKKGSAPSVHAQRRRWHTNAEYSHAGNSPGSEDDAKLAFENHRARHVERVVAVEPDLSALLYREFREARLLLVVYPDVR